MPVAVTCPDGHKRATPESTLGREIRCPDSGCSAPPFTVPEASDRPCYRTAQLTTYEDSLQKLAAFIFNEVTKWLPRRRTEKHPGSYSILATTFGDERTGKIVLYQSGQGQEWGDFPSLDDGVYIFIRANDASAAKIWTPAIVDVQFKDLFRLMNPEETLGVVPPCDERFTYFRVDLPDGKEARRAYIVQVISLLVTCCKIC